MDEHGAHVLDFFLIKDHQSNFQKFDNNCDTTMRGMWKVCIEGHDALGLPLSKWPYLH